MSNGDHVREPERRAARARPPPGRRARLERPRGGAASSALITPPDDCMIVNGASSPRVASRGAAPRRSVPSAAARTRSRRWSPSLVLAALAQDLARTATRPAGSPSRDLAPPAPARAPGGVGMEQADRHRLHPLVASEAAPPRVSLVQRSHRPRRRAHPLVDLMRAARHQRRRLVQRGRTGAACARVASSSTSRNPRVVTQAGAGAPRRSSTALVATVVP